MPGDPPGRVLGLVEQLLPGALEDPLAVELSGWLTGSARFEAFVEAHRDKIRKKLRGASEPEARADVRAELLVARLLVADRSMQVAFEAYGATKGGPDFTVTYRGQRPMNVEVTRPHRPVEAADAGPILSKLRQLPPGAPNALLVAVGDAAPDIDIAAAVRAVRARADARDDAYFAARGFETARRFYERFLRLGAVIVFAETAGGDDRAKAWPNPSARIAVPDRSLRAVVAALRAPSGS